MRVREKEPSLGSQKLKWGPCMLGEQWAMLGLRRQSVPSILPCAKYSASRITVPGGLAGTEISSLGGARWV